MTNLDNWEERFRKEFGWFSNYESIKSFIREEISKAKQEGIKDGKSVRGYMMGYEQGKKEERAEIIQDIAEYSGLDDIQTKKLIKYLKQ